MNKSDELVARIDELSIGYSPNEATIHQLKQKSVVAVLGPFGVGKSTLMNTVEGIDQDFGYVLGIVTRPKRKNESGTYRFIEHTTENLSKILNSLETGEIVQVTTHPITKYVYGSDLQSYAKQFNILDIFSTYVDEFSKLPFNKVEKVYVVAPVEQWLDRIRSRGSAHSDDELIKRWREAKVNLEWGLANQENIDWVVNSDDQHETVARQLIQIGRSGDFSDVQGPRLARGMLAYTNEILSKER